MATTPPPDETTAKDSSPQFKALEALRAMPDVQELQAEAEAGKGDSVLQTAKCEHCGKITEGLRPSPGYSFVCCPCIKKDTAEKEAARESEQPMSVELTCNVCNTTFTAIGAAVVSSERQQICPACSEANEQRAACIHTRQAELQERGQQLAADEIAKPAMPIEDRAAEWMNICPPLYRDTDLDRLRAMHGEKVDSIIGWQHGSKGLLLIGPTRTGKTRLMYSLLERLWFEGCSMHVTSCCGFGHSLLARIESGWLAWLDFLAAVPILAIDDLGKGVMSERVSTELFYLVENRMANLRPIIATTNMVGDELSAHVGYDRGVAMVARLRECCESVSLSLPKKPERDNV